MFLMIGNKTINTDHIVSAEYRDDQHKTTMLTLSSGEEVELEYTTTKNLWNLVGRTDLDNPQHPIKD